MNLGTNGKRLCLLAAWLIAVFALMATLYSSIVLKMAVCHLCWFQRIFMYPLVLILGLATFFDDFRVRLYALPMALIGAIFALYQYLEQMIPGFAPIKLCGTGPACSDIHIKFFGFITFPFLSIVAFLLIAALVWFSGKKS